MASQQDKLKQATRLINLTMRTINELVNDSGALISLDTISSAYKQARNKLSNVLKASRGIFEGNDLKRVYDSAYQRGREILDIGRVASGSLDAGMKLGYESVKNRFEESISEMVKMANFNLVEREKMHKEFFNTLTAAQKRRNDILKKSGSIDEKKINQITQRMSNQFNPVSGVKKYRSEYFKFDSKETLKVWQNKWSEISEGMTSIMGKGFRSGETFQQTQKKVLDFLQKSTNLPSDKFPYAVRNSTTGKIETRHLGMKYYTEMKVRYFDKTMETKGTVDVMMNAGFDLAKYTLHGGHTHTDICISMTYNGFDGVYSLSGQSKIYPILPFYPPAHYNCYSTIDPLPASQQERIEATKQDKEETTKKALESPQNKSSVFDKREIPKPNINLILQHLKNNDWDAKYWEKEGKKRIYINDPDLVGYNTYIDMNQLKLYTYKEHISIKTLPSMSDALKKLDTDVWSILEDFKAGTLQPIKTGDKLKTLYAEKITTDKELSSFIKALNENEALVNKRIDVTKWSSPDGKVNRLYFNYFKTTKKGHRKSEGKLGYIDLDNPDDLINIPQFMRQGIQDVLDKELKGFKAGKKQKEFSLEDIFGPQDEEPAPKIVYKGMTETKVDIKIKGQPESPKSITITENEINDILNERKKALKINNNDEFMEYIMDEKSSYLTWENTLTAKQISSLESYKANYYKIINGQLRNGLADKDTLENIYNIDNVITKKLDNDYIVYRTFTDKQLINKIVNNPDEIIGTTYLDKGFVSTTTSKDFAFKFGIRETDRVIAEIRLKKGTKVATPENLHYKLKKTEQELLLGRNHSFLIIDYKKIEMNGKIIDYILVEVI